MPAVHAGMTEAVRRLPVQFVGCSPIGEFFFPSVVWEKACFDMEGLFLALCGNGYCVVTGILAGENAAHRIKIN